MKALVVGLGSIGMRHARNLKALNVEAIHAFDPDAARRGQFHNEIGGTVYASLDGALAVRPDLAAICSPSAFHVLQARQCAAAGCHLFIEKPLGTSRDGIAELIAAVTAKKLFAHVGSNWKFHAAFRTMKRLLDEHAIGTVTGAQILAGQWLPDWHPNEDYRQGYSARRALGGGIVFDAHEFDYVTWLLGRVADLRGFTAKSGAIETETEDVACACLRLETGTLVTVHVDYIQRTPRRRYHISGTGGTMEWDLQDGRIRLYRPTVAAPEDFDVPVGDANEMYVAQMRSVIDGITTGATPVTPLSAAAHVIELQAALAANG